MPWRLLDGVPDEEVQHLMSVARRRTFTRNEIVFHQGDPADSMHMIRHGRFGVRIRTPLGDVATIAILGAGDAFGELALVGDETDRSATVVSLERSETVSISRPDLERLRPRAAPAPPARPRAAPPGPAAGEQPAREAPGGADPPDE